MSSFRLPAYDGNQFAYLFAFLVTIAGVCLATHTITTLKAREEQVVTDQNGKVIGKRPPMAPYAEPFIGHYLTLLYDPEAVMRRARKQCNSDVYRLNLAGHTYTVLGSTETSEAFAKATRKSQMDTSDLRKSILHRVFDLPTSDTEAYHTLRPELDAALAAHAQDEAKRSAVYEDMTSQLKAHLSDLVTFNPSPVDQEPWERAAQPTLSEDRESVDVDFFALVCTFLNHIAIDSMVSPSLLSQEPDTAKALVEFRGAIVPLMTGLSRMIPWLQLPKAHIARRQLMMRIKPFMRAVTLATEDEDPGPEYRDLMDGLETVKPLLTERQQIFSSPAGQQLSGQAISADFAHLLWTLCTPNALCFWMLVHLYATKDDILTRLREEVRNFASAVQPEGIFGFSVSPAVQLDIPGLLQGCPLLESCWLETIRLYGRGLDTRTAQDRIVIPDASSPFAKTNAYVVEKGDRVVSPSWAANLDETRWKHPHQWQGDRHPDREPNSLLRVDQHCVFGSDLAEPMTRELCLSFVATFISLWDLQAVDEKTALRVPSARFAAGVAIPSSTLRTRLRRCSIPTANDNERKE